MTLDEYAVWAEGMWFSGHNRPNRESICIMGLGLAGEAGEVIEHVKKFIRDGNLNHEELKKELGDALFYWARICREFGFIPSDVVRTNVEKLESRRLRGTLRGDGDNR